MRMCNTSSSRSVFGITVLCGILTVQIAWAADTWQLGNPVQGSSRTKTATVGGGGMTSAADGTKAIFSFGHADLSLGFVSENDMDVTANMMSWGGTLPPPPGSTWNVSPKDEMGMYLGDHVARISWGQLHDDTLAHIVTEN